MNSQNQFIAIDGIRYCYCCDPYKYDCPARKRLRPVLISGTRKDMAVEKPKGVEHSN
jgi:hypothetical protein